MVFKEFCVKPGFKEFGSGLSTESQQLGLLGYGEGWRFKEFGSGLSTERAHITHDQHQRACFKEFGSGLSTESGIVVRLWRNGAGVSRNSAQD